MSLRDEIKKQPELDRLICDTVLGINGTVTFSFAETRAEIRCTLTDDIGGKTGGGGRNAMEALESAIECMEGK